MRQNYIFFTFSLIVTDSVVLYLLGVLSWTALQAVVCEMISLRVALLLFL